MQLYMNEHWYNIITPTSTVQSPLFLEVFPPVTFHLASGNWLLTVIL